MDVRPGYKQTEVGVIPEDWDVKPLDVVLAKARLGGNYPNQDGETDFPLMKMGNIARGVFDLSAIEYISPPVLPEPQHRLSCGDVLFNTRNTLDLVGKVAIWRDELPIAYYNSNLLRLEFNPSEISSSVYANYWLNTTAAISGLRMLATGTTSVAAIYTRDLLKFAMVVPPLPEQTAIATALSDVDALLAAQDALIAKKRAIKQGAMQELLTGKRRLPGFSGEWEVRRLGTELRFQVGFPFSSSYFNEAGEGVRLVKNRDLKADDQVFHYSGWYSEEFVIKNGDVLIGMDGDFLPCLWNKGEALLNQRVGRIVSSDGLDLTYAYYRLREPLKSIEAITSSTTVKHLSHGDIEELEIPLPRIEEQRVIAEVLTDIDTQLTALETQRTKTAQLKQGMMQALLTGRIRLI